MGSALQGYLKMYISAFQELATSFGSPHHYNGYAFSGFLLGYCIHGSPHACVTGKTEVRHECWHQSFCMPIYSPQFTVFRVMRVFFNLNPL